MAVVSRKYRRKASAKGSRKIGKVKSVRKAAKKVARRQNTKVRVGRKVVSHRRKASQRVSSVKVRRVKARRARW